VNGIRPAAKGITIMSDPSRFSYGGALITNRFGLEIDSILGAFFRECSGLQLQTEVFEYSEGGLNSYTHKLPVRTKVNNITLKRGVVQDDSLWNWYSEVLESKITRRKVVIHAYENKGMSTNPAVLISWQLEDALPVKWVGPNFKADESAIAIDTLEFVCGAFKRI
jgi:phage tail-like protein